MFSLFDLDNISEKELLAIHPDAKGKNEFETRANIALILKSVGMLEDCPLFDKNNQKSFFSLLSTNLQDLKKSLRKLNISDEFTRKHRILYIYIIRDSITKNTLLRYSDPDIKMNFPSLFQEMNYYDESYYKNIKFLSNDDLYIFEDVFKNLDKPDIHYNISREFAKRIYDEIKAEYATNFIVPSQNIKAHLVVLALQSEDFEMIDILSKSAQFIVTRRDKLEEKKYYNNVFNFYPVIDALIYIKSDYEQIHNLVFMAISSVSGTSPYEHITYEQFIKTIEYLLDKSRIPCKKFFKFYSGFLNDRSKRFLLAAIVRLCGNQTNIGELASKYINLSYIPADKYI